MMSIQTDLWREIGCLGEAGTYELELTLAMAIVLQLRCTDNENVIMKGIGIGTVGDEMKHDIYVEVCPKDARYC